MAVGGSSSAWSFKKFDVVSEADDHHFVKKPKVLNAEAHRKISKEWRVLEQSLPDSIYVRAYDTRMDLMRAVIVGPAGTPYHDGLFFFDIQFPASYPRKPPKVIYRSFGYRINPNLYDNGKVCLSILNTWHGKRTSERWDPNQSTILQVLVSIQGLVLNEKPYFNEPGRVVSELRKWVDRSNVHNETVFLLSCQTMSLILTLKPLHFESFVVNHFRERAATILRACGAYASGRARIGNFEDATWERRDHIKGFRRHVEIRYRNLVGVFKANGINVGAELESFDNLISRENDAFSLLMYRKEMKTTKKKSGIVNKVVEKLKNLISCF